MKRFNNLIRVDLIFELANHIRYYRTYKKFY
jgi:hypothetical protein